MPEKIAILSDIHGNSPALRAVLKDIHNTGCTKLFALGDVFNGIDPNGCLDLLRACEELSSDGTCAPSPSRHLHYGRTRASALLTPPPAFAPNASGAPACQPYPHFTPPRASTSLSNLLVASTLRIVTKERRLGAPLPIPCQTQTSSSMRRSKSGLSRHETESGVALHT